jgi:hypothetical protein
MAVRDDIRSARLVRLYDYWNAKRRHRCCPSRGDIDPTEMSFVLGYIDLIDVGAGDSPIFRFRLSGSKIDEEEGFSMKGKTLEDFPLPKHRENIRAAYLRVVHGRAPDYEEIERPDEGRIVRYARLILPLSGDGETVNMLCLARVPLTGSGGGKARST